VSISNILSSAVSGLTFNAGRIAAAADNLANANTVGYKAADVQAGTLSTRQTSGAGHAAGGVLGRSRAEVDVQGLIQSSTSTTDLAIAGRGFFPVRGGGETLYTRSGSFKPDDQGYLVNAQGFRLLGYPTDARGTPTSDTPVPVNVARQGGTADGSTRLSVGANLPSDVPVGGSRTVTAQLRDSLGNPVTVNLSFERAGTNEYSLTIADPASGVTGTAERGAPGGGAYAATVRFDSDGRILAGSSIPDLSIGGLSSGAADLKVSLDLGGLTQYGADFVLDRVEADGAGYGSGAGVTVGGDGTVTALFDNGERRAIYQIPINTFGNPNGLESVTGNAYRATEASGMPAEGEADAGLVQSGALEQSTVDVGSELVRSIVAQAAYSFNLETIRAADEMQRELLDTKA
jgi:flagellar hook protein FlgE